jgi:hypothetical protein
MSVGFNNLKFFEQFLCPTLLTEVAIENYFVFNRELFCIPGADSLVYLSVDGLVSAVRMLVCGLFVHLGPFIVSVALPTNLFTTVSRLVCLGNSLPFTTCSW